MSLRSAARGFLAFLLSVPALQGIDEWTVTYSPSNVCALRKSTVDLSCTYEYPDNVQYHPNTVYTLWFTKVSNSQPVDLRGDADYTGRVGYSCGEVRCTGSRCHGTCTLRIKELRESDSAVYKFRFTTNQPRGEYTVDPGVTLSVTDLQVKVSFPDPPDPTRAELECHSRCGLAGDPPYIWYRNEQNLRHGEKNLVQPRSGGSYSCAVEGHNLTSPFVYAPKTPSVTVSPSGEIEEGSSVTLNCSSDAKPAANYTWFKVNIDNFSRDMNHGQPLVFGHILSTDSGQYRCDAQNKLGKESVSISINVQYGPKHTSVYSSPTGGIEEGSSVTLSCSSDANPAAEYIWFKEHEDSVEESGQNYTITNITSEHEGNYYCQAHNAFGRHNSSFLFIKVTSSSLTAMVAVSTIVMLLATILLLVFLWMRKRAARKACGQGGRPDTVEEPLPVPVYENASALTNQMVPTALREPTEEHDDLHYASIHTSRSKNQEVPRWLPGSRVQSDQTDALFYSVVNVKRPNAVPGEREKTEATETSVLYSTVKNNPEIEVAAAGFK
ncbi:B-cell receptor CD22-like isoform X2 [Gadus macrocephalus]|uniref:B-cell receptor CD22-like isoform X2 n=1 Tax=Gadus macrocephalus TaxID=80720 RepID=UPI0028CB3582|nr:B-cell receptor CD22-like isoform X2 [Gadus macrocephalus]